MIDMHLSGKRVITFSVALVILICIAVIFDTQYGGKYIDASKLIQSSSKQWNNFNYYLSNSSFFRDHIPLNFGGLVNPKAESIPVKFNRTVIPYHWNEPLQPPFVWAPKTGRLGNSMFQVSLLHSL